MFFFSVISPSMQQHRDFLRVPPAGSTINSVAMRIPQQNFTPRRTPRFQKVELHAISRGGWSGRRGSSEIPDRLEFPDI